MANFFKHWMQLLVSSDDSQISTDDLTECLKVLAAYFKTNTRQSLWSLENVDNFLDFKKHTHKPTKI